MLKYASFRSSNMKQSPGHIWASWRMAMAPPVEGSWQQVPCSLLLPKHGGRQQASAPTLPLPLRWQPPRLDPGARLRALRPTCSSFAPAPPPRAATGGLRYFLLPDFLSTAIPLSSEGSLTAGPSFLTGFGTNVTQFVDREEGGGNQQTFKHFNNQINKHKIKTAAPHGRPASLCSHGSRPRPTCHTDNLILGRNPRVVNAHVNLL